MCNEFAVCPFRLCNKCNTPGKKEESENWNSKSTHLANLRGRGEIFSISKLTCRRRQQQQRQSGKSRDQAAAAAAASRNGKLSDSLAESDKQVNTLRSERRKEGLTSCSLFSFWLAAECHRSNAAPTHAHYFTSNTYVHIRVCVYFLRQAKRKEYSDD